MDSLGELYSAHIAQLKHRYDSVMAQRQIEALVIGSGQAASKSRFDDQHWPLLVTPTFAHWLPLQMADCFLILRQGKKPTLIRTIVDDYWHSAVEAESDHFWNEFEIIDVRLGGAKQHFPLLRVEFVTRDPLGVTGGGVNTPDLLAALDVLRVNKTEYEIHCIAEASRRAVVGHRAAEKSFMEGDKSELTLHLAYLLASQQDALTTPYQNIVALGAHAAVLHHTVYDTKTTGKVDTSLLIDAGARYLGYGSDITRTYVRGTGAAARQFSALIAAVDGACRQLGELVEIGMPYEDLHDRSHYLLASALEEIGLLRGNIDDAVTSGVTRALFPHGLGHSLGLVTHDVGCKPRPAKPENKFLRNTSLIGQDNVFTIEPGVYFIESLLAPLRSDNRKQLVNWQLVDVLKPFGGVRVEDNVQVTLDGIRNLTREAFNPDYARTINRTAKKADKPRERTGSVTMNPAVSEAKDDDFF